jgi:hypothetical protein
VIPNNMLSNCKSIFSVEMPKTIMEIGRYAFLKCYCLRNVAFPLNAVIKDNIFIEEVDDDDDDEIEDETELCTDLLLLFGSDFEIIRNLKHRFDKLPVHSSLL